MLELLIGTLLQFAQLMWKLTLLFVGITFLIGLLQEYIRQEKMQLVLTRFKAPWGNIIGASFGMLTPFCSCSTIPIVVGLLGAGAPFGVTMSFLIASPILNPIIIALMLMLFGLNVTVFYFIFAFIAAVVIGLIWEKAGLRSAVKRVRVVGAPTYDSITIEGNTLWWERNKPRIFRAVRFAWNLFRQLFLFLLLGAAIGAIIHGFVPEEFIIRFAGSDNLTAIPIAAVIGVPLYIRASTILPISATLLGKGMGIGAVIALIIGGSGASIPEVALLTAIFRKKLVFVFVATVFVIATVAGFVASILLTK